MFADAPPPPVILEPCPVEALELHRRATCGFVPVPLDRTRPNGTKIRIYFERYPRRLRNEARVSTVVSIEGGPGYPVTPDRIGRVEMWRPISLRRDLLLVDLRGTGRSGALGCKAFSVSSVGYVVRAGNCAQQIGAKRDLYSTSQAVQDIEAVIRALRAGRIDLYGDSYGTYAAQAYALRFPARLRSIALDGAYPLPGTDPAWADLLEAVRLGLGIACTRAASCPTGDPLGLLADFAVRVRGSPIVGFAPDGDGTRTSVRLDEDALVQIASAGYWYPALWRDLLAALEAADRGDNAPILRLAAEIVTVDVGGEDPPSSSEALYLAVICHDYPQLWDPATPLAGRQAEADARLAAYPPGAFDPFTAEAWTGTDYEGVFACLRWPSPARADPPDPPGATYPSVPTLVLNGDLDTITTSDQAREVASRFPASTFVEIQNSFHVTALYDADGCASDIYTRFVKNLALVDTSCAQEIAEVRVVPSFPASLADTTPADPAPGDASTPDDRRLAAAAAFTVADVVARWWVNYDGTSVGLRGGRWSYFGDRVVHFDLARTRFVPGVEVTGKVRWGYNAAGKVRADVQVRGPGGATANLVIRWAGREQNAVAALTGTVSGRALQATMPAP